MSGCSYSHAEEDCPLPGFHLCGRSCAMCVYMDKLKNGVDDDDRPRQITGGRGLAGFKEEAQAALSNGDVCSRWAETFATEDEIVTVQEVEV